MDTNEFLTAILTIITGLYAFLTSRILRANEAVVAAMREEREAITRPYVTVSTFTLPDDVRVYLRVENTGRTAARDVRLTIDRPFHAWAEPSPRSNLQAFPAFSQVIESLGSGMRLVFTLATGPQLFGDVPADPKLVPELFHVRATYNWERGSADETAAIDLRPYGRSTIESDAVAEEIKKLRESLEKRK